MREIQNRSSIIAALAGQAGRRLKRLGLALALSLLFASSVTVPQTPTDFTVIPDSIGHYSYYGDSVDTVTIRLIDPEGDWEVPEINLNTVDLESYNLAYDTINELHLENCYPDSSPVVGRTELADSMIQLILWPDSVVLSVNARIGKFNPVLKYFWDTTAFSTSYTWQYWDEVQIYLGQSFIIKHVDTGTATIALDAEQLKQTAGFTVRKNGSDLVFDIPDGGVNNIRVFNAAGRIIAEKVTDSYATNIRLPIRSSSNVIFFEYKLRDGSAKRQVYHLAK